MNNITIEQYKTAAHRVTLSLNESVNFVSAARWLIDERQHYGFPVYEDEARKRIKEAIAAAEFAITVLKDLSNSAIDFED